MKRIKVLASIIALYILTIGMQAVAAERNYEINVTKDYLSAKISITVPEDKYDFTVISPDKVEYEVTDVDELNKECVINDPLKKGKWIVKAQTKEVASEKISEETESPEGEGETEEKPIEEIKDVKIKFEGSFEKTLDVNKDISVAADIVGLKMYFKDDNFVAEWTDTTIDKVNIEVTDEITAETLGKETVSERYYELPLNKSVQSIIVKIVPASSANENGAEKCYTYKFENNPAATVTYEDLKITNKDAIGVHVKVDANSYKALMMNNGKETSITEELKPGEYDFTIPTEVGDNNLLTYIVDENGNMRSTAWFVEKDVVAPILQLEREYVNINTHDESIELAGKVEDYDYFTINDTDAKVEGDHTFKYTYELKEGLNTIVIKAIDEAGNVSSYTATVTRIIPVEEPIPWLKIVLIVSAIGIAGLYIFDVIKKHRMGDSEPVKKERVKEEKEEKSSKTDVKGMIYDIIGLLVPCVLIVVIFKFVICVSVVSSASMEPTLMTGSTMFANRLYKDIKRGDAVIFISDEFAGEYFGKRVIGLPGDTIEFKNGYVVLNGEYLDESAYIPDDVETNCSETFVVPANCYFMLGDNREYSDDSRYWNNPYIPREKIKGVYMGHIDFSFQYDILNRLVEGNE